MFSFFWLSTYTVYFTVSNHHQSNTQYFNQSQAQQQNNFQYNRHAHQQQAQSDQLIALDYDKGIWATYGYCFSNAFNYDGRARRKEFWFYQIAFLIVSIISICIIFFLALAGESEDLLLVGIGLVQLVHLFPSLSLCVRRLHDINWSGWLVLLCLIPYIGGIFAIIIGLIDSYQQTNDWGLSPKYKA